MKYNLFLKAISSLPFILIILYFIPFLGVCLLILRFFVYSKRETLTSILLIITGVLLLIPRLINWLIGVLKLNINIIPYINEIMVSDVYNDLLNYSKLLITIGVIFLVVYVLLNNLFEKFIKFIRTNISKEEQIKREISEVNDLKIKEKQEKAKNTRVVYCKHCGANYILSEKTGVCRYCRRTLE